MNTAVLPTRKTTATSSRFSALLGGLWRGLEDAGKRRAARHLRDQAQALSASRPDISRQLIDAADAALRA